MDKKLHEAIINTLGNRIRTVRLHKGLRQNEVAKRCGFYKSGYNSIELGLRNVSIVNLYKIAFALDEPISSFLVDEDFNIFLEAFEKSKK